MKKSRQKNSNRWKNVFVVALISALAAVILTLFWRQKLTPLTPNISLVGSGSGRVDLTLTPSSAELEPDTDQVLTLTASVTNNEKLSGVQVEIAYNAIQLGTPVVTQGAFLTSALSSAKVENGKINFTYGAAVDSGGVQGSGTIATITIHPTGTGTSSLSFTENTEAYVISATTNMLKSATGTTVSVGDTQASASPSDQASSSPTSSPSSNPSNSPTPTLTPSRMTTLRLGSATCNSLSFSWDKIDGAKGYIIDLADNSNFDNKVSSGTLGSDRNNYSFGNLKNGTNYYARVTQTDIHDFPRYTQLGPISTLGSCAGAAATLTSIKPSAKVTPKPSASLKPSPTTLTSATPRPSLTPTSYTDNRFDNAAIENEGETEEQPNQSFFTRFISWLASLFD